MVTEPSADVRTKRLDLGPSLQRKVKPKRKTLLNPKILIPSPGRYVYYSVLSREKVVEVQSSEGASPGSHSPWVSKLWP